MAQNVRYLDGQAPKPRMGHILGYVDGFQGHLAHLQRPTFCGFHPLESPGKTFELVVVFCSQSLQRAHDGCSQIQ